MKILVAAVQMPAELLQIAANLERADTFLGEASQAGAVLAVLPEMFNTGYGLLPDFGPSAEGTDGPTLRHLSGRSREWRMGIVAGFVERDRRHLYDALALCLPDGSIQIYRKRHLVFWERFRFRPGRSPLIVPTPWGRIGLAICADMIYRNVWNGYRGQIDLGVIASAWPDFACRHSGRKHWLFGHLRPLVGRDPSQGRTGPGRSGHLCQSVRRDPHDDPDTRPAADPSDRRSVRRSQQHLRRATYSSGHRRGRGAARPLRSDRPQSPRAALMSFYVSVGPRGILFRVGMIWTGVMGSLTYWWTNRRRPVVPVPGFLAAAVHVRRALDDSIWSDPQSVRGPGRR